MLRAEKTEKYARNTKYKQTESLAVARLHVMILWATNWCNLVDVYCYRSMFTIPVL